MKTAYFVDGGLGRLLCSIPALEKKLKSGEDFVIISDWSEECFIGTDLYPISYPTSHKNLFNSIIQDREIITPEPYRLNSYFNQKCNLVQAFDKIINGDSVETKLEKITINLSKKEQIDGHNIVNEVKSKLNKQKVIVFQPFGRGIQTEGDFIYDTSGRSFEFSDVIDTIKVLNKNYAVILMTPFPLPSSPEELGVAIPENLSIRTWMGIINSADGFLGCDSVGQHIAYGLDKPSIVVTGSTFPENISYPDSPNFTIIDNGKENRKYSPIRISLDKVVDICNEDLMKLDKSTIIDISKKMLKLVPAPIIKTAVKKSGAVKHTHTQNCSHNNK